MSQKTVHYNDGFSEKWVNYLSPAEWRSKVHVEFMEVPLAKLEAAGCWTDPEVVRGWRRTLDAGGAIPPPVAVLTERGTYYLHDGNHRYEALSQYFEHAENAVVRIALAVPTPGHHFHYCWFGEYGTYIVKPHPRRYEKTARIAAAILASSAAIGLTELFSGIESAPLFVFFVLSVMIAAWLGGCRAGLLATFTNLIGAAYFVLPPNHSLAVEDRGHALQLAITVVAMIAVAFFMRFVRSHPSIELGLPALTSLDRRGGRSGFRQPLE